MSFLSARKSFALIFSLLAAFLIAAAAAGGDAIPNWSAPATWLPLRAHGVMALSETNPLPFQAVTPCRLVDTRGTGGVPINTGGSFAANEFRTWMFTGLCGLPASAAAVSLNITVTNTGGQTAFGFVKVWPGGGTEPNVSTLNWSTAGVTESNAAIVPFGAGGTISLRSGNNSSDVIVDTNGYYSDGALGALAAGERFTLVGDVAAGSGSGVLMVHNTESVLAQVRAGYFLADSTGTGSVGVAAYESAGSGLTSGVYGQASSTTSFSAGITGAELSTAGKVYGLRGLSSSFGFDSAGVLGTDGSGVVPASFTTISAGVRGESRFNFGVFGVSEVAGVGGFLVNSTGALLSAGYLGIASGVALDSTGAPWAVFASGNIGSTNIKHFVEPHPSDPTRVILYASLEGREVGTYFRGTAQTSGRRAIIEIPEDFRTVTDEEGLTVQLTPVGPLTTMSVESEDLNRIVVRSSQDVTFHYLVQGVRRAFKDFEPVARGMEFAPRSADERMPAYLPEEARRRLIANGTYNADGTVNMETAERLGWVKMWADREQKAKAAANAAAHAALMEEKK